MFIDNLGKLWWFRWLKILNILPLGEMNISENIENKIKFSKSVEI